MKILEWLGQWTIVQKDEYANCVSKEIYLDLVHTNKEINDFANEHIDTSIRLSKEIEELKKLISVEEPNPFKKHKVSRIFEKRKLLQTYLLQYDNHPTVQAIATSIISTNTLNSDNKDGVVLAVTNWWISKFGKEFKYVSDKNGDQWITPINTLLKVGADCENWSFFLYNIIKKVFVILGCWEEVSWRLIANRGNVNKYGTISSGGEHHIYLSWVAVKDNKEYTVESTYSPKMARELFLKKEQKINPAYGVISYSWNEKESIIRHWI